MRSRRGGRRITGQSVLGAGSYGISAEIVEWNRDEVEGTIQSYIRHDDEGASGSGAQGVCTRVYPCMSDGLNSTFGGEGQPPSVCCVTQAVRRLKSGEGLSQIQGSGQRGSFTSRGSGVFPLRYPREGLGSEGQQLAKGGEDAYIGVFEGLSIKGVDLLLGNDLSGPLGALADEATGIWLVTRSQGANNQGNQAKCTEGCIQYGKRPVAGTVS